VRPGLLGGYSASTFLSRFWQKRPLLIRGAIPGFSGLLDQQRMFALARRDDCESRLIVREGRSWHVEHGPLPARVARGLPARGWTLLVQGVDHFLPSARRLLAEFAFVPHVRLDDLMVSYAPPGGGVGPHVDSYDVFLLQGTGRRRWRVGRQRDLTLVENAPLKILKRFRPQGEAVLDAGDMLYLPPGYAHDGIAETDCYTYSIGFRAPRFDELKTGFLAYLDETIRLAGIYGDPDLKPTAHPATIPDRMIDAVAGRLARIRWSRTTVRDFLGAYLSEPKGHIRFSPPDAAGTPADFERAVRLRGVRLAPASRMLVHGRRVFLNGESFDLAAGEREMIGTLADTHRLPAGIKTLSAAGRALLHRWYCDGYIRMA
jgi:50S ribosomal protein L16 3-hydroxylase